MRKFLILFVIPMFFAVTACQKSEETAPESSAPAASAEASPAAGGEAAPSGGMMASPAAEGSPAAPASP